MEAVVGRWRLGQGQPFDRGSTLHSAGLIGSGAIDDRLVEVHRLPNGFDPTGVVATLREASRLSDPGMVTIVDVGSAQFNQQPVVYVVTARWQQALSPGPRGEDELLAMAATLAGGLSTLHRADLVHGALHRNGVRTDGSNWQLGPAGLAPLLETEIAPYRPPGLHVVEPMAPPADLWSLGVVLHEQASGRLLRPGEQPALPTMPRLTALVSDLLQPNPADRPTADVIVERLAAGIDVTAALPGATGLSPRVPPLVPGAGPAGVPVAPVSGSTEARRPLLLYGAVVAVILALAGVAGIALLGGDPDSEANADASADSADSEGALGDEQNNGADGGDSGEDQAGEDAGDGSTTAPDDPTTPTPPTGPVSLGLLVIGDCVDVNLSLGDPTSAQPVNCEDDHVAEVVGLVEHASAADGAYPGRAALIEEATVRCDADFEEHVGGPSLLTSLFVLVAVPTFGEWDGGERRTTVCLAHGFDGSPINGGLAGRYGTFQLLQGSEAPISKLFGAQCFESDGGFENFDRRQVVTLVACENLHRHEVLTVEVVPLEPEEVDSETLTPEISTKLANESLLVCEELWNSFTVLDESNPPTIIAIVPGVLDWQLGDRLMTCTASWDNQVIGSVVIQNLPPPGDGEEEDDG